MIHCTGLSYVHSLRSELRALFPTLCRAMALMAEQSECELLHSVSSAIGNNIITSYE
jgi:hypothetical protein